MGELSTPAQLRLPQSPVAFAMFLQNKDAEAKQVDGDKKEPAVKPAEGAEKKTEKKGSRTQTSQ